MENSKCTSISKRPTKRRTDSLNNTFPKREPKHARTCMRAYACAHRSSTIDRQSSMAGSGGTRETVSADQHHLPVFFSLFFSFLFPPLSFSCLGFCLFSSAFPEPKPLCVAWLHVRGPLRSRALSSAPVAPAKLRSVPTSVSVPPIPPAPPLVSAFPPSPPRPIREVCV